MAGLWHEGFYYSCESFDEYFDAIDIIVGKEIADEGRTLEAVTREWYKSYAEDVLSDLRSVAICEKDKERYAQILCNIENTLLN